MLVFLMFFQLTSTFAVSIRQTGKQIDSLLKASISTIYENPDKSIELGLAIFSNEEYSLQNRTRALMLVSLGYTSKRDYQKALEYILKADDLSRNINDQVLQIDILFRTGILYQQLKVFDKSIEYLEKTERLALLYPVRDSVGKMLANSYAVKGYIYKDNLNCDIALEFFDKGISVYEKLTIPNYSNLSIIYYNKGNCYVLLSDYENARKSFNQSIYYAKLENASSLIAFAQKGMAHVYLLEGNYEESIELFEAALKQASKVGDLVLNLGIYGGLFESHLALNNWDQYQKYYNLYLETQLEIKTSERNSISDYLDESDKILTEELRNIKNNFQVKVKWILTLVIFIIISIFLIHKKNKRDIISLKKKIQVIQNS